MKRFKKTDLTKNFVTETAKSFEEFEKTFAQHKMAILAGYENSDMQFVAKSISDLESEFGMFTAGEKHRTKDFDGSMKTIESESIGKVKCIIAEVSQETGIAPEDIMDKVLTDFSKDLAAEMGESYEEEDEEPKNWHSFIVESGVSFELNDMSYTPLGKNEASLFIRDLTSTVPFINVNQMPCGYMIGRFADEKYYEAAISYARDLCHNTKAKYDKWQTEEIGYMSFKDENGMRCVRIDFDCM